MKQPLQLAGPKIKKSHPKNRDWVALNRAAVQTGATSCKDLTNFRMQHNIWQKEPAEYRLYFDNESKLILNYIQLSY